MNKRILLPSAKEALETVRNIPGRNRGLFEINLYNEFLPDDEDKGVGETEVIASCYAIALLMAMAYVFKNFDNPDKINIKCNFVCEVDKNGNKLEPKKKCYKCGAEQVDSNFKFCPYCGAQYI